MANVYAILVKVRPFTSSRRLYDVPVDNSELLEVSYLHLALSKPILAYFLNNSPAAMLTIFDEVALAARDPRLLSQLRAHTLRSTCPHHRPAAEFVVL